MIEREMTYVKSVFPYLVYEPSNGVDFKTVKVRSTVLEEELEPTLLGSHESSTVEDFLEEFNDESKYIIRDACSLESCSATLFGRAEEDTRLKLKRVGGATIACDNARCPLMQDPGGSSGDREPRKPLPHEPARYAEVDPDASVFSEI